MNHIYRLKKNRHTLQLQPVPETARSAGKGRSVCVAQSLAQVAAGTVASAVASVLLAGVASLAHAQQAPPAAKQLPQGGVVSRGSASITSNTATAQMTVNQTSARAVIDWASFNIGSQAKVHFNQPDASAVVLNQVQGNNASQIYGQISSNGQVILSNPSGVYFSPTASVDVGSLVATTGKAHADEFMAGKTTFNREGSTGSVVNQGQLKAALGGYIALLAPEVRNQGIVIARAGTVALATGEAITLSFNNGGSSLAGLTTTPQAIAALVDNQSAVLAEGGQIILSAHALASLQGAVIKNSGQLSATGLTEKGGKVVLMADKIELTGTSRIDANGPQGGGTVLVGGDWQGSGDIRQATQVLMAQGASIEANATDQGDGGKVVLWSDIHNTTGLTRVEGRIEAKGAGTGSGGQIETSGYTLQVGDLSVNAQGSEGKEGQWLLDPYDITISSASDANTALAANTFTASATGGVVNVTSLQNALATNNVTVSTAGAGTDAGNITVSSDIAWSSTKVLTLLADGAINGTGKITMSSGTAGAGVVFNQGSDGVYSGVISGSFYVPASLTKSGAGTLTLSGVNSYLVTTIDQGILKLGNGSAVSGTSLTINSGATLDLAGWSTNSARLVINGTGVGGNGALINTSTTGAWWNGDASLGGSSLINALTGNITLGSTQTITGSGFSLTWNNGGQIKGALALGTGSLTKTGTGTLYLDQTSTYSGGTTVLGGSLFGNQVYKNPNPFGTGDITVNGGTLDMQGASQTAGAVAIGSNGGSIDNTTGTGTFVGTSYTVNNTSTATISADLTGASVNLSKSGTGTLILTGANTYTGSTSVTGGTLQIGNANTGGSIAAASTITLSNGTTLAYNLSTSATPTNAIVSATAGAGTIANNYQGLDTTLNLSSTGVLTGYTGSYSATYNEGNNTLGSITLSSAPNFNNSTLNVVTSGFNAGFTNKSAITWTGTASGTPALTLNGNAANSGQLALGATLTLNSTGLVISPGAAWSLTNNGSTLYLGATHSTPYTLVGSATAEVSRGATVTQSGALSGTGDLTVIGNGGTLTLSGLNSYSGNTTITSGTLKLGNVSALGSGVTGTVTVSSGGALDLGGYSLTAAKPLTLSGSGVSNGGALTNSGATSNYIGPVTLAANTTIGGGSGSVGLTNATAIAGGNFALTLGGSGTASSITTALDTSISSLTKVGSGTWTLNGSSTYSGGVSINGGTLALGSASALASATAFSFGGGTLKLFDTTDYSALFSTAAGQLISLDTNSQNVSLASNLTSSGGTLTKSGAGTLTLLGNNSYSGGTTVTGGVLKAGSTTALGSGGITVNSGGALDLAGQALTTTALLTLSGTGVSSGGALMNSGAATTYAGLVRLSAASSIMAGTGALTLSHVGTITGSGFGLTLGGTAGGTLSSIIGTGTGTLTKQDSGTWTLNASNTYTGATTLNGGVLSVATLSNGGTASGIGQSTNVATNLVFNGGTLQYTGAAASTDRLFTVQAGGGTLAASGTGALTWSNTGLIATVAATSPTLTLTGTGSGVLIPKWVNPISSGASALSKSGSSTWTLSATNTYTGGTTVNAGVLMMGNYSALGGSSAGMTTVINGAAIDMNGQNMTVTGPLTLNGTGVAGGGALFNSSATGATYSGPITLGSSSSVVGGVGSISLSNSSTISGGGHGLTLGGAAGGSLSSILSVTTASLTKEGAGSWTLYGANTWSGGTTVSAGKLQVGNANAFGTGAVTVANGAYIDLYGYNVVNAGVLTLNGTGVTNGGALVNNNSGAASYSGLLQLGSATSIISNNGNITLGNTGLITGAGLGLTLGGNATGSSIAGSIDTGTGTVTKQGNGAWTLNGASTYSGGTLVSAGTLKAGSATAFGIGTINVSSTGKLDINGQTMTSTGGLTLNNTNTAYTGLSNSSSTTGATFAGLVTLQAHSVIDGGAQGLTLSNTGTIVGNNKRLSLYGNGHLISNLNTSLLDLTKDMTGAWTVSGDNTYSSGTYVSAGTLKAGSATAFGTSIISVRDRSVDAALDLNGWTLTNPGTLYLRGTGVSGSGALMNSGVDATYAGPVVLWSNSSIVGGTGAITLSNAGNITGNTFGLTLGGAAGGSISSNIATTTGSLTKQDSGTWTLSGNNTYSGGTSINAGTLVMGSANALGTAGTISFGGGTLRLFNTNDYSARFSSAANQTYSLDTHGQNVTLANNLTSSGGTFSKLGSGVLTLSGNNTYTGVTTVNGGTLSIAADNALGTAPNSATAGSLILDGGTLAVTADMTLSTNRGIALGSGNGTIDVANGKTLTYGGVAAGASLTKAGNGTLVLAAANTYTGTTTVSAGVLGISHAAGLGTMAGGTTVIAGATLDLKNVAVGAEPVTLNGGSLSTSTGSSSLNGDVTLGANSTVNVSGTQLTLSGVISGANDLTKGGAGTLVLGGINTYGSISVNAGTLQATNASALGSGTVAVVSGATVAYNVATNAAPTNTFTGAGTISNLASDRSLDLSGATVSGFTGTYEVALNESVSPNSVASMVLPSGPNLTSNTLSVNTTGFDSNFVDTPVITWSGSVSGTPALKLNGNTVTANQMVNSRSLGFNSSNLSLLKSLWTMTINGVVSNFNTTAGNLGANLTGATTINIPTGVSVIESGLLTGGGNLTITGGGSILLSGNNSYTGSTSIINNTTLTLGHASALGTGTNGVTVASGGVLDLNGQSATVLKTLTLNGSGLSNGGALKNSSTTAASWAGPVVLGSNTTIVGGAGTIALLDVGAITGNGFGLTLGGSAGGSIAGNINIGAGALTKQDSGTWLLSGSNSFSGATNINAGTLAVSNANGLGTSAGGTTVASGATLDLQNVAVTAESVALNGGTLKTSTGSSSLGGDVALGNNSTVDVGGTQLTLSGVVSGTGDLSKSGNGTLTLGGANTYSGATTLSAGTLQLGEGGSTGNPGSGTVRLNAGVGDTVTLALNGVSISNAIESTGAGGTQLVTSLSSTAPATIAGAVDASATGGIGFTTATNASLRINGALATGSLTQTFEPASGGEVRLGGAVSGSGTLQQKGAGVLSLAGDNSGGNFTLAYAPGNTGTIRLANSNALGSGNASMSVPEGATLALGAFDGGNLSIMGKTLLLEGSQTGAGGGALRNVVGDNTWAGAVNLNHNSSVTVDTGAMLSLPSSASTLGANSRVYLNLTNGDLNFGALTGTQASSAYQLMGSGALSGTISGVTATATLYARLYDATGLYTSSYGDSPVYSLGFYTAASGGILVNPSQVNYSGTPVFTGLPSSSSNATTYSVSYASGLTVSGLIYTLAGAGDARAWTVLPKTVTLTNTARSTNYDGTSSYGSLASGMSFTTSTLVGADVVASVTQTASGTRVTPTGLAQAGDFTVTPGSAVMGTGLASNYSFNYVPSTLTVNPAPLAVTFTAASKVYDGNTTASLSSTDNRLGGDVLTVSASGNFTDKNVGTGKTVTVSGVSLSGADANNYTVSTSSISTTANITRLSQVSWVGGASGNWFDPANWAGGAVPDLTNVARVMIPVGVRVNFDTAVVAPAQEGTVSLDALGTAGTMAMSGGTLNVGSGGVILDSLSQSGGNLSSAGALAVNSLSQTGGALSASSLSTTTAYNQTGTGTVSVTGPVQITATAAPVVLGHLSTTGDLTLNSTGGPITQSAGSSLLVAGTSTLSAASGGQPADVTLANAGNALTGMVTVAASKTTVVGASDLVESLAKPTLVVAPVLPPPSVSDRIYEFRVLKLPDVGDGFVQLELKGAWSDWRIPLPQYLQKWLAAAKGEVKLVGPTGNALPGVDLLEDGRFLGIKGMSGQRLPDQVVLQTPQARVVVRLLKMR